MAHFVDRRLYDRKHKSAVNRERFLRRYRKQIKKAVSDAITRRSIKDMDKGEKIVIPAKDIAEPTFHHGQGGHREYVYTGNKEYNKGDKIKRPEAGSQSQGNRASNKGQGSDDFIFEISRSEFLDLFFDDLELPELVKKDIGEEPMYKFVRAGYSIDGVPTNINIIRSFRGAIARRIALRGPHKKKLVEIEDKLTSFPQPLNEDDPEVNQLLKEKHHLEERIRKIPFIDTFDIRYNYHIKQPKPSTQAVMFCLMDVSGSMDESKKDIAKRFFILLYLFLTRSYEHIEIVFIRHHTTAKIVEEDEFFYSRETGGTVVSSALELMKETINKKYPTSEWNIYGAQASDGDNWNADSPYCKELLLNDILPKVQYFSYVEILPRHHQSLWEAYKEVLSSCKNFSMQHIHNVTEIYPVFRELFKRHTV